MSNIPTQVVSIPRLGHTHNDVYDLYQQVWYAICVLYRIKTGDTHFNSGHWGAIQNDFAKFFLIQLDVNDLRRRVKLCRTTIRTNPFTAFCQRWYNPRSNKFYDGIGAYLHQSIQECATIPFADSPLQAPSFVESSPMLTNISVSSNDISSSSISPINTNTSIMSLLRTANQSTNTQAFLTPSAVARVERRRIGYEKMTEAASRLDTKKVINESNMENNESNKENSEPNTVNNDLSTENSELDTANDENGSRDDIYDSKDYHEILRDEFPNMEESDSDQEELKPSDVAEINARIQRVLGRKGTINSSIHVNTVHQFFLILIQLSIHLSYNLTCSIVFRETIKCVQSQQQQQYRV